MRTSVLPRSSSTGCPGPRSAFRPECRGRAAPPEAEPMQTSRSSRRHVRRQEDRSLPLERRKVPNVDQLRVREEEHHQPHAGGDVDVCLRQRDLLDHLGQLHVEDGQELLLCQAKTRYRPPPPTATSATAPGNGRSELCLVPARERRSVPATGPAPHSRLHLGEGKGSEGKLLSVSDFEIWISDFPLGEGNGSGREATSTLPPWEISKPCVKV